MPRKGYRKPKSEARTQLVHTRLTPHEKEHLLACVEQSDVHGMADYIRLLIMDMPIPKRLPNTRAKLVDEIARLNRKLASIDNSMNQLAKTKNSGRIVSEITLNRELEENRRFRVVAAQLLQKVVRGF